jgi:hypothetical protein
MSRIELTGPTDVFVDPNGSDTLGDGSIGNPWKTPQGAWNNLFKGYDLCGNKLDIVLKSGAPGSGIQIAYPGINISGRLPGQAGGLTLSVSPTIPPYVLGANQLVTLRGSEPTNPLGVILHPGGTHNGETFASTPGVSMTDYASLKIKDLTIDSYIANKDCIALYAAFLTMENIHFGNANWDPAIGCNHIAAAFGALVVVAGPTTVHGSAISWINTGPGGYLYFDTNADPGLLMPFTINNNPQFPRGFILNDGGYCYPISVQFNGTAQGPKFRLYNNGVINTGGQNLNYLPGNQPGWFDGSAARYC